MTAEAQTGKQRKSILYGIARALAYFVFWALCPLRVHQVERLNRPAPYLLIGNHNSWLDPMAMCYRIHGQQVRFLGKKELVRNPLVRVVLTRMGMIAVDRHHSDMEAMRACMRVLREGRILLVFPEGTRHHTGLMDELEGGTALMALRCKTPLVPVYLDRKFQLFRRVNMYVGPEIPMDDLIAQGVDKAACDQLLARITGAYAAMAAEAAKGAGKKK